MKKSAGYIWPSRNEQFGNCDYRTCSLTLNLELCRPYRWVFMVANIHNSILGADFLKNYGLIVDMSRRQLLDTRTQLSIQGVISLSSSPSPTLLLKNPTNDFTAIMVDFPSIDQPCSKDRPTKHDIRPHQLNFLFLGLLKLENGPTDRKKYKFN